MSTVVKFLDEEIVSLSYIKLDSFILLLLESKFLVCIRK